MKNNNEDQIDTSDIPETTDEQWSKAVRGRHAAAYAHGTNLVLIDADVFQVFGDAETVNRILREIATVITRSRDAA